MRPLKCFCRQKQGSRSPSNRSVRALFHLAVFDEAADGLLGHLPRGSDAVGLAPQVVSRPE